MRLLGQFFSGEVVERIRAVVTSEPTLSRSALSRRVCEWLDWRTPTGQVREVSCRKALGALERRGMIALPPPRRRAGAECPASGPGPVEAAAFAGTLAELGAVTLLPVVGGTAHSRVWNWLLEGYHPLGSGPLVGAQLRYLMHSEAVGWLGGLAFSAAAWQLRARDEWIGWDARARVGNLSKVVCNSRFLMVPSVVVPHLASHVLSLAARRLPADWAARYGEAPVLLETFVDETVHAGTCYRAANWQRVGETTGRGRQDRENRADQGVKGIYVRPLCSDWRARLCQRPTPSLQPSLAVPPADWAAQEFGRVDLPDGRLVQRLLTVARDFGAQPLAPIPQACQGDAGRTKGAYRLFQNAQVDLPTLLHPHREATVARLREHAVVLAVQDTTSLNYSAHPATEGLGPINTRADGAVGMLLHATVAFSLEGVPLGVLDAQCWVRDPAAAGQSARRKSRPIEAKESRKWLHSYRQVAALQPLCPTTRLISVGDREADLYELFLEAQRFPQGPDLLIRADRGRQRQVVEQHALWDHLAAHPVAGVIALCIPGQGGRQARTAPLTVRFTRVDLQPPQGHCQSISVWAVYAREESPPADTDPVEWLLLTTVATATFADAVERLRWYALRWGIEVYHRTLKSGCRLEDRRLGTADSLQACLAIDLVVAWRIHHLAKLGRETPEVPCSVFFAEEEWQALCVYHSQHPVPPQAPPTLGQAMRLVAKLGGFLGRKGDGHPGTTVLWRGLQRLEDITQTFVILRQAMPAGP